MACYKTFFLIASQKVATTKALHPAEFKAGSQNFWKLQENFNTLGNVVW